MLDVNRYEVDGLCSDGCPFGILPINDIQSMSKAFADAYWVAEYYEARWAQAERGVLCGLPEQVT